ncbi:MAG: DUF2330 domain-containing protein [Candidatus Hydrogenedentes bacterium]|nr:DUF2330 domain-containing protein [Candidatus Hydrogenedentota bacterium]
MVTRRIGLRGLFVVLGAIALGAGVLPCKADGIFAKDRLQKKLPAIPWQRAIISYKDGVERLTIHTAVDADGGTLGWIVPVPATPTDISKGSVGGIQMLATYVRPRIVDGKYMYRGLRQLVWIAGVCTWWAFWCTLSRASWKRLLANTAVAAFAVAISHFLFASHMFFPPDAASTETAGQKPGPSSVTVESAATIGSYDVVTLKAEKAEDLRAWLTENGFSELPGNGDTIVAGYLAEGWRFVAAKLRRDGAGVVAPHPLTLVFPAQRPIYPMRLTALSASDVYLELFVVSNEGVASKLLTRECCSGPLKKFGNVGDQYAASELPSPIQHPGLRNDLWEKAAITKLAGTVRTQDMDADIVFDLASTGPFRQKLYAKDAAVILAMTAGLKVWIAVSFVGTLVAILWTRRVPKRRWGVLLVLIAVGAGAAGATGAVKYAELPITDTVEMPRAQTTNVLRPVDELRGIAEAHGGFQGASLDEIAQVYADYFAYTVCVNPYTGRHVELNDAPGNVTVDHDATSVTVRTYDEFGVDQVQFQLDGETIQGLRQVDRARDALDQLYTRPDWALNTLLELKDERAVGPLIEILQKAYAKDPSLPQMDLYLLLDVLEQTTGYRYGEKHEKLPNQPERWAAWWAENQGKSRVEWLRGTLQTPHHIWQTDIAIALAQLGDASMIDLLLFAAKDIQRLTDEDQVKLTKGLLTLKHEEGYRLFKELALKKPYGIRALRLLEDSDDPRLMEIVLRESILPLSMLQYGKGYTRALLLCQRDPQRMLPILRENVRKHIAEPNAEKVIAFEASALGLITRTTPPVDVKDRKAMEAFLVRATTTS